MTVLKPSDLLRLAHEGVWPAGPVAIDTETSGLHVDSGARISTVSVAWLDPEEDGWIWGQVAFDKGGAGRLQEMDGGSVQTWDIEKIDDWEFEAVISFAWAFDQGVSGTGKPEDSGQGTLWSDADNHDYAEWVALVEWLKLVGERVGHVYQNGKFDLHMFRAGVRRWPDSGVDLLEYFIWDTQNGNDLLWGMTGTTSLKPTAQRLWGEAEGDEQAVIKAYLSKSKLPTGRWDLMPWDVIGRYADQDPRLTIRLYERQLMELRLTAGVKGWFDGEGGRMTAEEAIRRRLETTKMLYRVERRGLPFKVSGVRAAAQELAAKGERLRKQLPFQPPTLAMAKHYWFGEGTKGKVVGLGRTPYATTGTGEPQLDKAVMVKVVRDGLPGAEIWRDAQKVTTADSKWYTGWADRAGNDDRLRISFRQNGTVSGRFSAEGAQLHAIPHDYRLAGFEILEGIRTPRQLIGDGVPAGWELWELDLAQAELRVAAMFAGCKRMLRLIEEGQDLHGDACEELFDIHPGDADWGQYRNVAKRANFSLIFGVGPEKLQADIEEQTGIFLPLGQVQKLVRDWNNLYPEFQLAIRATMAKVETRQRTKDHGKGYGWIVLPNGERRWFKPGEESHKAFNQRVQPNLAQFGIDWWLSVEQYLMQELGDRVEGVGGVGMVLMVHDSMVLLLPAGEAGRALVRRAVDVGVALWAERFPGVPGDIDAKEWVKA